MKSEIKVNPVGDTLTILEGKTLELKHPVQIELSGNIESVKNFLEKRYAQREGKELQKVDKDLACVVVDMDAMSIKLFLDPQNPFGTKVSGDLTFSNELLLFHVNDGTQTTREAFVKLIRFNKRFFDNAEMYDKLLQSYMKMNLSFSGDIKAESDNRGNKEQWLKKQINSEKIPTEFTLKLPIFKGQPEEKFRVEILLDATDASVRFWFESTELVELIEKRKKEIFDEQLKSCQDFVIIHK